MMASDSRQRVTIELRGLGAALQARAVAEHSTVAALARRALVAWLQTPPAQDELFASHADTPSIPLASLPAPRGDALTKVTLRMPARSARNLAVRARQADVSQGDYVARLLDELLPPPQAPDHAQAVAALLASTDQLAVLASDINAFMRALRTGSGAALEAYRASVMSLGDDVRIHLGAAAALMAELKPSRKSVGTTRTRSVKPRRPA